MSNHKSKNGSLKISIICFDMAHNCLGRAYLLAKVLNRRYQVEIHGSLFPYHGGKIWKPCDTGEFKYFTVKGCKFPKYFSSIRIMLANITGDVVYACKPRTPSFGIALLKKFISRRPVVLDIDDLETSWFTESDWRYSKIASLVSPVGPLHTKWMERLSWMADDITTVSTQLQKKFGGIIVPHGKDTAFLDPDKFNRKKIREEYGLDSFKVIMFLGTPTPHKGLEEVVNALKLMDRDDIRFVMVGKGSNMAYENKLQEEANGKIIFLDMIPFNDVPKFLSIADLVVLPQRKVIQAYGQIPAKLFDAMAMAKSIISTNVSDIPAILEGCGLIVEAGDINDLAKKIEWVFSNPNEAEKLGQRAREKCIREYSWDVMEERLSDIFEKYR